MDSPQKWILAFDAGCGTCRFLAGTVKRECEEKLEIQPLNNEDVSRWRQEALGANPPWTPTLIRIQGEYVRAWTGPGMAIPLAWRLGPRSTFRLLLTMGELRNRRDDTTRSGDKMRRKDFLKFGMGFAAATGLVLFGKTPAFPEPAQELDHVSAWVKTNLHNLPRDYDGFAAYDISYRRAIHEALAPSDRSRLWTEHLKRVGGAHINMSTEQASVFDRAMALAADERNFTMAGRRARHAVLDELRVDAIAAFGLDDARTLLATLGPGLPTAHSGPSNTYLSASVNVARPCYDCECSPASNYCGSECCANNTCYSRMRYCTCTSGGCGTFYSYGCGGYCGSPGCSAEPCYGIPPLPQV